MLSPPGHSVRWRRARARGRAGSMPSSPSTARAVCQPDDVEALELVQQGLANWHEDRWSEIVAGMGKEGEQLNSERASPAHLLAALERADGAPA